MSTDAPLTIVLVLATPGTTLGGMEKHTMDLATGLAHRGHRVHVIAHRNYASDFPAAVTFHLFPMQLGRRNLRGWWQMRKLLRIIQPDILHAQGNKAAALIQHCGPSARIKLATVHGTKSSYGIFRKLDGVIAVNHATAGEIPNSNCRVIYNGVATSDKDVPATLSIPEGQPFALAAGRLEPVKQYDKLIEAWGRTNPGIPLYILGEGSQREDLERQVTELGLTGWVHLPGYEVNVRPWLQAASLCVISSSREGFPYILAESLVNGCPVLSTPVNGALEYLPADCLAASTSTDSIATLLARHFDNPNQTIRSEQPAFYRAGKELTVERMADNTESFYHELLENGVTGD